MLAARRPAGDPSREIGLGWIVSKTAGGREIGWHNGGTGGFRSFMGFDPKARTGVVLLSNTSTAVGVDDIGMHLLDRSMPLTRPPAPVKERTAIAVDRRILERYVGRYELTSTVILIVRFEHLADEPVEAQPGSDRRTLDSPLVVDPQAGVGRDAFALIGRPRG